MRPATLSSRLSSRGPQVHRAEVFLDGSGSPTALGCAPDPDLYLQPSEFPGCFASGLPASEAAVLAATQRPLADSAVTGASGPPAWKTIVAMTSLAVLWAVRGATGSFAAAGVTAAVFALAEATAGPQVARLVEDRGQRRILPWPVTVFILAVSGLIVGASPRLRANQQRAVLRRLAHQVQSCQRDHEQAGRRALLHSERPQQPAALD